MKPGVKGVQDSESELGYVVGDNTSEFFHFVIEPDSEVKKWEYVYMDIGKNRVIGRVERIISKSELLNEGLDYESVSKYIRSSISDIVNICVARSLGAVNDHGLELSRDLIRPGVKVFRADSQTLEKIFSFDSDRALDVGFLADRPDVKVSLDVNGLRRHLAIVAQTGAGKSHTAGVIMEELLKKGASIIVLDPHADYALMRKNAQGKFYSDSIRVYRTPLSTGRYQGQEQGFVDEFTLRFQDLESEDVTGILGIKEGWTNLIRIVDEMLQNMAGKKDLDDFLKSVSKIQVEDQRKIAGRLRFLNKIKQIFSDRTTSMNDYLAPGQMTILDLSGMDQFLANYFSFRVLNEVYEAKLASDYKYPVFVFIEEAHNFVPPKSNTQIAQMIKRIAGEGRKFGIFLVVITQRPGKIDQDVLSQCNSEIILRITNPLDQKAVIESGESITEAVIEDLPSLNVGEGILVGEFVKMPVIAKMRPRETMEGGGDVDLITLLKEARNDRDKKYDPKEDTSRISKLLGDF